ncbi:MAG TPA: MFS transporter [Thermomicrobiales bacterium]
MSARIDRSRKPRLTGRGASARRRRRLSLGLSRDALLLFWGLFWWEFGYGLFMYLLTLYMQELGATSVQIGTLVGIQGLARFLMYIPSGIIAERYSRRLIIIWTTFATAPAAIMYALAQTWWHLIPGLILFVVANLGTPAYSSYIAEAGAPNRARAFALIYTVGPSASLVIAPLCGGWLADRISMRLVFVLSAISFLIATIILWQLSERPLVRSSTAKTSYMGALRTPIIRAVALFQLAVLGVLGLGTTLLPNFLHDEHGLSLATVGNFGSIAAVGSILLSFAVGRSAWLTAIRAIALATLAIGLVCVVPLLTGNIWILAVAFLGRGGLTVAWSLFAAVLSDTVPMHLQARAFALAELLGALGFGLAPFAAGALYDWHHGSPLLFAALATPALAVVALWIERRFVIPSMAERKLEASALADQASHSPPAEGMANA